MRPRPFDEAVEETGAAVIAPAKGPPENVVDIRDLRIQQFRIGRPEGQPPDRIGPRGQAEPRKIFGGAVVMGHEGRQIRAEVQTRAAPVSVAKSTISSGASSSASRQRIGKIQATIRIGIADLDAEPTCGFAKHGRRVGRRHPRSRSPLSGTSRRRHRSRPDAITNLLRSRMAARRPAHILLSIRLMAASGLIVEPPRYQGDAFAPTRVTFGASARLQTQVDRRRGATRRGPAHGHGSWAGFPRAAPPPSTT